MKYVFVKFSLLSKKFIVGSVNRPSSEIEPFIFFFDPLLQFNVESTDLFSGGDCNIDLLKVDISDSLAVQFYNTISSLSMVPTITWPIHIARTSCTVLNRFLVTNLRNFKTGILRIDITDHVPVFLFYESYFDSINSCLKK